MARLSWREVYTRLSEKRKPVPEKQALLGGLSYLISVELNYLQILHIHQGKHYFFECYEKDKNSRFIRILRALEPECKMKILPINDFLVNLLIENLDETIRQNQ